MKLLNALYAAIGVGVTVVALTVGVVIKRLPQRSRPSQTYLT